MRANLAKLLYEYDFIFIMLFILLLAMIGVVAIASLVQSPMEEFVQALDECLALDQFSRDECVDIAVRLTQDD